MDDFDHDALYYRVLGDRPGYCYRTGEPAQIAGEAPDHGHPFYEFDDLRSVGGWLFLGDRVLVLRVPRGAEVEVNTPMSQGGCMTYSASRVERVGLLSLGELMRAYEAAGVRPGAVHLAHQRLDDDLRLPACGVDSLYLDHCGGRVDLSGVRERVALWDSPVEVLAWPAALDELRLHSGALRGRLPAVGSLSLDGVELSDVVVPAGTRDVRMFRCTGRVDLAATRASLWLARCDLEVTGLPPRVQALYADDNRFLGVADLPAADHRDVKGCTFA